MSCSRVTQQAMLRTLRVSAIVTLLTILAGYPLAFFIARQKPTWRGLLLAILIFPFLLSAVVRAYGWDMIVGDRGIVNNLLIGLGLLSRPIRLIKTETAIVIGETHLLMPYMVLSLLAVIQRVDPNLAAAAASLGARPHEVFWRVLLPLTLPGLVTGTLLVFALAMTAFATPFMLHHLRLVARRGHRGPAAAHRHLVHAAASLDQPAQPAGSDRVSAPARPTAWGRTVLVAGRSFMLVSVAFWLVFLAAPIFVTFAVSLTATEYTIFPPAGLSLRWYGDVLRRDWFLSSIVTSAVVASAATALAVLAGLFGAVLLARRRFRGQALFEYLLLTPLIIPSVVIGFALFNAVLQAGMQQRALLNLIVGHAVVTLPFTLRSIWSSLLGVDRLLEDAALSLGATPPVVFRRVTLPSILPGIVAGAIIAFTFSFNDVTVSIFLVGPTTRTLPVELMSQMEYLPDPSPAAASAIIMLLTLAFFVLIERTIGLDVFAHK
jgi:putative spermidine/putrescine transport system permease protein